MIFSSLDEREAVHVSGCTSCCYLHGHGEQDEAAGAPLSTCEQRRWGSGEDREPKVTVGHRMVGLLR